MRGGNAMKKSKKFIVGVVLSVIGVIGAISAFAQGVIPTGIVCLLILLAGIVLIVLDKKKKPQQETAMIDTAKGTHSKIFKVAGVTFDNRQKHLAKLMQDKLAGKVINVELQEYVYENQPAIKVIANGLEVGSLHTEDVVFIKENQDRVKAIKDLYVSSFVDEKTKEKIYYAKLTLTIENKNKKTALLDWSSNR
jgi:ribosome assembly protein YihI (activator of Der GTPase)